MSDFLFGRRTGGGFEVASVVEAQRLERERFTARRIAERHMEAERVSSLLSRKEEEQRLAAELSKERDRGASDVSVDASVIERHCPPQSGLPDNEASVLKLSSLRPISVLKNIASDDTREVAQQREHQQSRRAVCKSFGFPELWVTPQAEKVVSAISAEVQNAAYNVGCAKVFTKQALDLFEQMGLPCLHDKVLAPVIEELQRSATAGSRRDARPSQSNPEGNSKSAPANENSRRRQVMLVTPEVGQEEAPSQARSAASRDDAKPSESPVVEMLVLPPNALQRIDPSRPPLNIDFRGVLQNVLYFAVFGARKPPTAGAARNGAASESAAMSSSTSHVNVALAQLLGLHEPVEISDGQQPDAAAPAVVELVQHLFWFVFAAFFHHKVLDGLVAECFPRIAECFGLVNLAAANSRVLCSKGMILEKQSVGSMPIDYACQTIVHTVCLAFVVVFPKNHNLFTVDFCNRASALMFLTLMAKDTDAQFWDYNRRTHFAHPSISIDDVAGAAAFAQERALAQLNRSMTDEEELRAWQHAQSGQRATQRSGGGPDGATAAVGHPVGKSMSISVFGKVYNLSDASDQIFDVDFGKMSLAEQRTEMAATRKHSANNRLARLLVQPTELDLMQSSEGRRHLMNADAKARFSPSSHDNATLLANHIQSINILALERAATAAKSRGVGIVDRRATRLRSVAGATGGPTSADPAQPKDAGPAPPADDDATNVDASSFHLLLAANAVVCSTRAEEMARGFKRIVSTQLARRARLGTPSSKFRSSLFFSRETDFLPSAAEETVLGNLHRATTPSVFNVPELTTDFRANIVDDIVKRKCRRPENHPSMGDPEFEQMAESSRKAHRRKKNSTTTSRSATPAGATRASAMVLDVDDPFEHFGDVLFGIEAAQSLVVRDDTEGSTRASMEGPTADPESAEVVGELLDVLFPPPPSTAVVNKTREVLFSGKIILPSVPVGTAAAAKDAVAKSLLQGGDVRASFLTLKRHESISLASPTDGRRSSSAFAAHASCEVDSAHHPLARRSSSVMDGSSVLTRRDTMKSLYDALHSDAEVGIHEFEPTINTRPDGSVVQRIEASQTTPCVAAALRYRRSRQSPTASLWLGMTKACNSTVRKIDFASRIRMQTAERDALLEAEHARKRAANNQSRETTLLRYAVERTQLQAAMSDPLKRTELVGKWIEQDPPRQKIDMYRHAAYFAGSALTEEAKHTAMSVREGFLRVDAALAKPKKGLFGS